MITARPDRSQQVVIAERSSAPPIVEPRPNGPARNGFVRVLAEVAASRQTWLFAAVWLAAAATLLLIGQGFSALQGALFSLAYVCLSLVTVAVTRAPPAESRPSTGRSRLWLELGLLALFIALTAWRGLAFHHVIGPEATIPLWSPMVDALQRKGDAWFGNSNFVANPVLYVGLPLPLMLLAGARLRGLGFGPGHRTARVLLLWTAVPLAMFGGLVVAGVLTPGVLVARIVSNALNNGFFEEFLFRGALQTRLRGLIGPSSALILQAVIFGVWHLGLGFTDTDHAGLAAALASTLVHQSVIGLAYGVIFERTRNLVAPSVVHVLVNSMY